VTSEPRPRGRDGVPDTRLPGRDGAILMTYGSPDSLERGDVGAYLTRVRGGRPPDDELLDEFTRRYRVIGGSPLIEITRKQAAAVSGELGWPVEIGMRFSDPSIEAGLRALAGAGVMRVAAIILSPQFSPLLMGGYQRAIDAARASIGAGAPEVSVAGAWHEQPAFVDAIASGLAHTLAGLSRDERRGAHVLMTAHSLPRRVAEQEPAYLEQLRATADAVAAAADLSDDDWSFCWQSAGHEPGEWMKRISPTSCRGSRPVGHGSRSSSPCSSWPTISRRSTTSTWVPASRPNATGCGSRASCHSTTIRALPRPSRRSRGKRSGRGRSRRRAPAEGRVAARPRACVGAVGAFA